MQLSTGYKKQFIVTKRFHLVTVRLSKYQRNQVFGVLKAGSTVNDDIALILAALDIDYSLSYDPFQQNRVCQSSCKTWSRTCDDVTFLSR